MDGFAEIGVFTRVVDARSFTRAGSSLGLTPSGVSRVISRLDPIAEGIDVTLRMAALRDSELASRRLGAVRVVTVGAPRYFANHGRPRHPGDLAHHTLIGFLSGGGALPWQYRNGYQHAVHSRLHSNSVDVLRDAAIAGLGMIRIFEFHIADELARGRLEAVLVDHEAPPKPVHALYAGARATTPKVHVFLDWVSELIQAHSAKPSKPRRAR